MLLSIIIPAFNEEKLLGATLTAVRQASAAFSARGWQTEFIVCDNNSTDRTAAVALAGGAKVVFEPVNQIGRARNRGAEAAAGDWLLFVDADSQPSAELLAEVGAQIAGGHCLAGGSTIQLDGEYPLAGVIAWMWNGISRFCGLMAGSFIFCDAASFQAVGGFSPELFAAEEIELSRKLKKLGRHQRRRLVILHHHPLLTSARKIHLYRPGEHFRFLLRVAISPAKFRTNRQACSTWYDGRR